MCVASKNDSKKNASLFSRQLSDYDYFFTPSKSNNQTNQLQATGVTSSCNVLLCDF